MKGIPADAGAVGSVQGQSEGVVMPENARGRRVSAGDTLQPGDGPYCCGFLMHAWGRSAGDATRFTCEFCRDELHVMTNGFVSRVVYRVSGEQE